MATTPAPAPHKARLLLSLDEIGGHDLPLVGGKAFRLARLRQNGFQVPQGLAVTAAFFESQLRQAKLVPLWAGSPNIAVTAEALNWLADALKTKPLAPETAQALKQRLDELFGPEVDSFAVRSSAIDEDQRDHAFAGIHLTELGVPRSAITIALTRCWASALSEEAIEYRQAHGMSIQSIKISVLIQPMLAPQSAGVGFTINPLTGSRDEMVIEAIWGMGNDLVSGYVQPYFYRLASQPPHYALLEYQASNTPPTVEPEAGTGPLSQADRAALAQQLNRVHMLMGEAQDVEWAKEGDTFYLLQTRPVVSPAGDELNIDYEWTRGNHPEDVPELPSPLYGALLEQAQLQAIDFFQDIGLKVDQLGPYQRLILGRPYLNLTFLRRGLAQVGINPDTFLGIMGYPAATTRIFTIDWKKAWQTRRVYWLAGQRLVAIRRYVTVTQTIVSEAIQKLKIFGPTTSPADLHAQFQQQARVYRALATTDLGLSLAIAFVNGLGSRLLSSVTSTPISALHSLALRGLDTGRPSLQQSLQRLAQTFSGQGQVKSYLQAAGQGAPQALPEAMPSDLKQGLDHILAIYGHRSHHEADPNWPRYREDARPLLAMLVHHLEHETWLANAGPDLDLPELEAVATSWRGRLARPVIGALRRLLTLQTDLDEMKSQACDACRQWNLTVGQHWTEQGWLAQPSDIFWLTLDEIERTLMLEQGGATTLSANIQARKATYATYAKTDMPFTVRESQLASIQLGLGLTSKNSVDVMIGLPVSPGQARGRVMVIHHLDGFDPAQAENQILVLPSTNPTWLVLLKSAAGLIVETGGLLSHGSIIAREYGLPAVANIPHATRRFKTGEEALVDGSTGVIQRLDQDAP